MPELPEVETTCLGLAPFITNKVITEFRVWQPALRWPIPDHLASCIEGDRIRGLRRRGKYLLFDLKGSSGLLIHLGMSGSLRILTEAQPKSKHVHWQLNFGNLLLRYRDPRRFGALLYSTQLDQHPLLGNLGPEPLADDFDGDYLYQYSRRRKRAVKNVIMDGGVVVGIGNIYAAEALFLAGIHPARAAGAIGLNRYQALATTIKAVIHAALQRGGTTLKDYVDSNNQPGYFGLQLKVYGRNGQPCNSCLTPLKTIRLNQRASTYCPRCQR